MKIEKGASSTGYANVAPGRGNRVTHKEKRGPPGVKSGTGQYSTGGRRTSAIASIAAIVNTPEEQEAQKLALGSAKRRDIKESAATVREIERLCAKKPMSQADKLSASMLASTLDKTWLAALPDWLHPKEKEMEESDDSGGDEGVAYVNHTQQSAWEKGGEDEEDGEDG